MDKDKKRKALHQIFIISIIIKGIDGVVESAGGFILLVAKSKNIVAFVRSVFHHELAQDPHDFIANHLIRAFQHLSHGTVVFAAIYLCLHGLIKIGLVTALLYKKLWAYPLAAILLALFTGYEIFRYFFTYSYVLLFLIIVDTLIIILLRFEYKDLKQTYN